ncbi:MAG: hypothetical protein ACI8UO_000138 [Verrucomicrobiales bacterium]|jgi:hypothetical protein
MPLAADPDPAVVAEVEEKRSQMLESMGCFGGLGIDSDFVVGFDKARRSPNTIKEHRREAELTERFMGVSFSWTQQLLTRKRAAISPAADRPALNGLGGNALCVLF